MSVSANQPQEAILRPERQSDGPAIETVIADCFGAGRTSRSVRHLRHCNPIDELCFVIEQTSEHTGEHTGEIVGSIRYWPIMVGGTTQLLLGPLAVRPDFKGRGYGSRLVAHSLESAAQLSHDFILISGEPDYYPRFGFEPVARGHFIWPGALEAERLQVKWLQQGARDAFSAPSQAILPILPTLGKSV